MKLLVSLRRCLAAAFLCAAALSSAPILAQQAVGPAHSSIPFKTEPSPLESHGDNLVIALLVLLVGASAVLFVLRRRLPKIPGLLLGNGEKRIRLLEQARLGPRSTLYLVRHNDREILIGQCGDTLTVLDAASKPAATEHGDD